MSNMDLGLVDTIVVVMMENRSFDHLLGYLSLEGFPVDGLKPEPWLSQVANPYRGLRYRPFEYVERRLPADPPHERIDISLQVDPARDESYSMQGFVESYASVRPVDQEHLPAVMGYYTKTELPLLDMFARSYAVCDRWFSPLPAGTQSNRLMAMSGSTLIEHNTFPLPYQPLIYDWLTKAGVSWRVYHSGLPFFSLMAERVPEMLTGPNFWWLFNLWDDASSEGGLANVVFVEPKYGDDPTHIGEATDHHPPASIIRGQEFLGQVYAALTANPKCWARTVMIVTYDEHGGFFDHVHPLPLVTPGNGRFPDFKTTGVRVPAFVVSPLVRPGTVFSEPLDHTSILRLIGERFPAVASQMPDFSLTRPGLKSVSDVLNLAIPRTDVPKVKGLPGADTPVPAMVNAFKAAASQMRTQFPEETRRQFGELWHVTQPESP